MIILVAIGLSGCSTIDLSDISTGAGATLGAVAADAIIPGASVGVTVAGSVVGGTVGASLIEDKAKEIAVETVREVVNPWQALVVAFNDLLNHAFEIVIAISIATIGIPMLFSYAIGKLLPRKKEKETMEENKILKKIVMEKKDD